MRAPRRRTETVRQFILNHAGEHPGDISRITGQTFGISRQSVAKHLESLVGQGLLRATGRTKGREYRLEALFDHTFEVNAGAGMAENQIWRQEVAPRVIGTQDGSQPQISENVLEICQFGFTEILNNVAAHGGSSTALVRVQGTAVNTKIMVSDQGVGIFNKLQNEFGMQDSRHALLELVKGKLTTRPESHTGEGIFYTSGMFDRFSIISGSLFYRRSRQNGFAPAGVSSGNWGNWKIEAEDLNQVSGTTVFMEIHPKAKHTVQGLFDRHAGDAGGLGFNLTQVPVKLARYDGEQLVSRSQSRRLTARLDRFKEVVLDFQDVATIGQSFADEVFRVYAGGHPETRLSWINTQPKITQMIQRVRSNTLAQLTTA